LFVWPSAATLPSLTVTADQPIDPRTLRDLATQVATEAADLAVRLRRERLEISTKSTATDLVTNADRAVEELIGRRLAAARPDDHVVGEEGEAAQFLTKADAATATDHTITWIIDPIDGTTNYVYDHPGWAVSIAAARGDVTIAGAVVDPSHGDTYEAAAGHGSTRNGSALALPEPPELDQLMLATGFSYDPARRARHGALIARLLPNIRDTRRMGAASVDFCSVAAGRVDAYFEEGLAPWDMAAGVLVATEAGARMSHIDGGTAVADEPNLCCHPERWDELAAAIIEARDG
jgi:myo-inositol-1(or 4)-monophosphatase